MGRQPRVRIDSLAADVLNLLSLRPVYRRRIIPLSQLVNELTDDAYFDFTCKCGPTHTDCAIDCQCACHDKDEFDRGFNEAFE